jgi:hypothetical protein
VWFELSAQRLRETVTTGRMYAPTAVMKRDIPAQRLLCKRSTFSKSVTDSAAVSKLGCRRQRVNPSGAGRK